MQTTFSASMVLALAMVSSCQAFWWGTGATREASDPTPTAVVKQVPVGYIRTFTYQPLHFNPAVAQQLFTYPTLQMPASTANSVPAAKLMVNPLQYLPVPQKSTYSASQASQAAAVASSSSSSYSGPLQAQQSVQQVTAQDPSAASPSSSKSGPSSSNASNNGAPPAPAVSIAESLTSDEHLPVARDPMPLQQQPIQQQQQMMPQTPQQPFVQAQFQASLPAFLTSPPAQQYTIVAPPQQPQQQQYPASLLSATASTQPRVAPAAAAPQPNNYASGYLPAYFNEPPQPQMQSSYPYGAGGYSQPQPAMPSLQMPVQFVPCMCPVSYAYSPPSQSAEKRSDSNEQAEQQQQQQQHMQMPAVTVTDYHQMMEPMTLVSGPETTAETVTDDLSNVGA